jgi:8-oxo-dGTP pyrophosphatase MutT (NUDIX family)
MDAGETPGETAVREIREELGLAVTLGTSLVVDFGAAGRARTRALPHFLHGRRGLIPEAREPGHRAGARFTRPGLRSQPSVGDPPPVSGAAVRVRAGMDRAS